MLVYLNNGVSQPESAGALILNVPISRIMGNSNMLVINYPD